MSDLAREELVFDPKTLHISGVIAQHWNKAIEANQNLVHTQSNQGRGI